VWRKFVPELRGETRHHERFTTGPVQYFEMDQPIFIVQIYLQQPISFSDHVQPAIFSRSPSLWPPETEAEMAHAQTIIDPHIRVFVV
jgi:hypothetical protein